MARVKGGVHAKKKHKAVLARAKGFRGARSRRFKVAKEAVFHAERYAYRDRRRRKGDFRKLWITRINAAARIDGMSYSRFMHGLKLAEVDIDRKNLADMAVREPEGFAALVAVARSALDGDSSATNGSSAAESGQATASASATGAVEAEVSDEEVSLASRTDVDSDADSQMNASDESPFGEGSARSGEDGLGPQGWAIKGNSDSMLYHSEESPYYGRTKAEVWFETEAAAEAAGFQRWDHKTRKAGDDAIDVIVDDVAVADIVDDSVAAEVAEVESESDAIIEDVAVADVSLMQDASVDSDADGEVNPEDESPFGEGSAAADEDGSGPQGWAIKGNSDSMLYHSEESPYYGRTKAEVWFETEAAAEAAGFQRWDHKKRD